MAAERIAVIGGGIGGLALALALKRGTREVIIVERDAAPPAVDTEAAFEAWARPGVPQFRHAHMFLARLRLMLREHHPELLRELLDAGLELANLVLPTRELDEFGAFPGDEDLLHLWGRRPTFEYVLRRHVERLPNVRFVHSTRVVGLATESTGRTLRVRGLELARGGNREVLAADVVVDAAGKRSKCPEWLDALGVRTTVDRRSSGFVYACRHYRLFDRNARPPDRESAGNLDFLGYAAFYAEHDHFALTLGCPVEETELAAAMHRTEGFEALCNELPAFRRLASGAEPTTRVLGAGLFENRWSRYGAPGGLALHGFFAVGDSLLETNPMYGRGCTAAFMAAHLLADVLDATANPGERARRYDARARALLNPYFELSASTDRIYQARAKVSRGQSVPLGDRFVNYLYEKAFLPATRTNPFVAREFLKAVQMREPSSVGTRLRAGLHILRAWLSSGRQRTTLPLLAGGVERGTLLRGLPAHFEDVAAVPAHPQRPSGCSAAAQP